MCGGGGCGGSTFAVSTGGRGFGSTFAVAAVVVVAGGRFVLGGAAVVATATAALAGVAGMAGAITALDVVAVGVAEVAAGVPVAGARSVEGPLGPEPLPDARPDEEPCAATVWGAFRQWTTPATPMPASTTHPTRTPMTSPVVLLGRVPEPVLCHVLPVCW